MNKRPHLSQQVKELGTHILVCEVFYNSPAKGKLNFRKFFKFQVMKPLDVKTKFYNAEVILYFLTWVASVLLLPAAVMNQSYLMIEIVVKDTLQSGAVFKCDE